MSSFTFCDDTGRKREVSTAEEVMAILEEIPSDSEIEGSSSDEDEDVQSTSIIRTTGGECVPVTYSTLDALLGDEEIIEINVDENLVENNQQIEEDETNLNQPVTSVNYRDDVRKVVWKKKQLPSVNTQFLGQEKLPHACKLESPYQFFKYFITDSMIKNIVDETNLFIRFSNPNQLFTVSSVDIQKYLGICIFSSIINVPNIRMLWNNITGNETVRDTMPLTKFEKI